MTALLTMRLRNHSGDFFAPTYTRWAMEHEAHRLARIQEVKL
jgi:hypothetical protein